MDDSVDDSGFVADEECFFSSFPILPASPAAVDVVTATLEDEVSVERATRDVLEEDAFVVSFGPNALKKSHISFD